MKSAGAASAFSVLGVSDLIYRRLTWLVLLLLLLTGTTLGVVWAYQQFVAEITVAGTVRDELADRPVVAASVTVHGLLSGPVFISDGEGRFLIPRVRRSAGLEVVAPGYQRSTLAISKDNVSDIYLTPNTLEGIVFDAYTRTPLADALISASGTSTRTNGQGQYRLVRVMEATKVQAIAEGYAESEFDYTAQARQDIVLRPDTLAGQVSDARTSDPIPQAKVLANGEETATDQTGYYKLIGLPETFSLAISAPGYHRETIDLQRQTEANIRLSPFEVRGLYLSFAALGDQGMTNRVLDLLKTTEANAVVIDIKGDRGWIAYQSEVPMAREVGAVEVPAMPDFDSLMAYFKENDVYTIARIVVFKDNPLGHSRPELAIKNSLTGGLWIDGEGLAWVDPFREEVWDYNVLIAKEATRRGFDEIQFDYIRFPTDPSVGSSVGAAVYSKPNTQENRLKAIEGFLAKAHTELKPLGAHISVDTFGATCWHEDDMGIGQRIETMAQYVDYLSPMLYPSTFESGLPMEPSYENAPAHPYEIVFHSLQKAQHRLRGMPLKVRPWLQYFDDYPWATAQPYREKEILAQKQAAVDANAIGWMLWDPFVRYDKGGLEPPRR